MVFRQWAKQFGSLKLDLVPRYSRSSLTALCPKLSLYPTIPRGCWSQLCVHLKSIKHLFTESFLIISSVLNLYKGSRKPNKLFAQTSFVYVSHNKVYSFVIPNQEWFLLRPKSVISLSNERKVSRLRFCYNIGISSNGRFVPVIDLTS